MVNHNLTLVNLKLVLNVSGTYHSCDTDAI